MTSKKKKTQQQKQVPLSPPQIGKKRLWAFRTVSLIILPLLIFGGLELSLRIFGVGYPTQAVISREVGGKPKYCHNPEFGWRFFPKNIARDFDAFVFDIKKAPQTYRIFVLGESAAMGVPTPSYSFGRILEVMLRDTYPEINFEVHNAAMVAINSHVILEIAKDCAKYNPDLFIVYMGNNEVVGPFGPGTVFSPMSPSLPVIRANIAVKTTRTGQLLEQVLESIAPRGKTPQLWGGMEMFLEKQVRRDSPALKSVYTFYEANLRDICNAAHRCGADVIVSDVGVNLKDSPPFASLHRDGLTDSEKQTWEDLYQKGVKSETAGDYEQAIEYYLAAGKIDETFADLQFRLGKCLWDTGQYEKAKTRYINAMEYDTLRFRTDTRINEIIKQVANGREDEGIYFVDSVAALEENSPHQTPGEELFYEHVHFNFKGNYILAKTIFLQLQKMMPTSFKQHPESVLSEEQAAEHLAYTGFERHYCLDNIYQTMLGRPPFINQLYHEATIAKIVQQMQDLSEQNKSADMNDTVSLLEAAIQKNPDDWHLHWQYALIAGEGLKDTRIEEIQLRKVIQLCPYDPAYLALGKNLRQQGRTQEAKQILYQLLEIKSNSGQAHFELASIALMQKDNKAAIKHLTQEIRIEPTASIQPYGFLADMYEKSGNPKKAIQTLYNAIEIFPEKQTSQAHSYLGYLLYTQGKYKKALEELETALKINPDCANQEIFQKYYKLLKAKLDN